MLMIVAVAYQLFSSHNKTFFFPFEKSPGFYTWFKYVAKNYRNIFTYFYFHV
jgi:hypothetical protein